MADNTSSITFGDVYEDNLDETAIPKEQGLTDLHPEEPSEEEEEEEEVPAPEPDPVIVDEKPEEPNPGNTPNEGTPDKVTEDVPPVNLEDEKVKTFLAERFKVESFEQVEEILNDYEELLAEHEELKKKPPVTEPVFKSDFQRKAYEHALRFESAEAMAEGFSSYLRLTALDVPALEGKDALREAFLLENPEIPAADADEVFEDYYYTKYEADATKLTKYALQRDIKEAKAKLSSEQEKAKAPVAASPTAPQQEEIPVPVQQSIKQHVAAFEDTLKGVDKIAFSLDADESNTFHFEVSKEQLDMVAATMRPYLEDPAAYDKDGKLKGKFDAIESRNQLLVSFNYDAIVKAAITHGVHLGKEAQVRETAGQKPTRQPGVVTSPKRAATNPEEQKEQAIRNWAGMG